MRNVLAYALCGLGLTALAGGCHHVDDVYQPVAMRPAPPAMTVSVPPPAAVIEQPSPEPYPGAVWMAGYWDYRPDIGRHVWVAGRWTRAPRPGVVWMPPRWEPDGHGRYHMLQGHWANGVDRDAYGRHVYYDAAGRPHYF
jgi:hypothetical protein